jgi:glycosyltransferase involved in cell wall biosynthesis
MKVAVFFGNAGNPGPHGSGTERYELELARAMACAAPEQELHYIYLFANGPQSVGVTGPNVVSHVLWPQVRQVSLLASLPALLAWLRPDVLHATYIPPLLGAGNLVYTLPCSSPFLFPNLFSADVGRKLRLFFRRGMRAAHSIVCYSRDLQSWVLGETHLPPERVPVIPMAASSAFHPFHPEQLGPRLRERFGIDFPYFLFSGRWEERKNLPRIVEAFARFKKERRSEYKLVLSGSRFWAAEAVDALIARLGIGSDVVDLGRTPYADLPQLYAGARALVFPSLWETFGLPLVEAMACGTPTLTSNNSCLPEVAGGAALLVDPFSIDEIAAGLDRLASDDDLAADLKTRGLRRSQDFSWDHSARLTLEHYRLAAASIRK